MHDQPLAYFITFTVYGTFLQGDARWWRSRGKGSQTPQPVLEQWHRDRLQHDIMLLDTVQRSAVENETARLCDFRRVAPLACPTVKVRDQIKANCTRVLRKVWPKFLDRPVWTVRGDWRCVNSKEELEQVILYSAEAQDRKARDIQ